MPVIAMITWDPAQYKVVVNIPKLSHLSIPSTETGKSFPIMLLSYQLDSNPLIGKAVYKCHVEVTIGMNKIHDITFPL